MDVFLTVDNADHVYYRRPMKVAIALLYGDPGPGTRVRTVTVLDRSTGLTSTYRDSEADL